MNAILKNIITSVENERMSKWGTRHTIFRRSTYHARVFNVGCVWERVG